MPLTHFAQGVMGKGRQYNRSSNVAEQLHHPASTPRDCDRAAGAVPQPAGFPPGRICRLRRSREVCSVPLVRAQVTGSRRVPDGPAEACAHRQAPSLPGGGDDSSDEDDDRRDFVQQPLRDNSAAAPAAALSLTRPNTSSRNMDVPLPLGRPPARPQGGL